MLRRGGFAGDNGRGRGSMIGSRDVAFVPFERFEPFEKRDDFGEFSVSLEPR